MDKDFNTTISNTEGSGTINSVHGLTKRLKKGLYSARSYLRKDLKRKILASVTSAFLIGGSAVAPVLASSDMNSLAMMQALNGSGSLSTAQMAQMVMGVTGGIPIPGSSTSKYTYNTMWAGGGSSKAGATSTDKNGKTETVSEEQASKYASNNDKGYANAICKAGSGGKNPTVNESVSYQCIVIVNNGTAIPPVITLKDTPTESGEQTLSKQVGLIRWPTNTTNKGSSYAKPEFGVMNIEITYNAYEGTTSMAGTDPYSRVDTGTVDPTDIQNGGNTPKDTTVVCEDGSLICKPTTETTGTGTTGTGTTGTGTTSTGTTGTGTDGTDVPNGTLCPDGTYVCSNPDTTTPYDDGGTGNSADIDNGGSNGGNGTDIYNGGGNGSDGTDGTGVNGTDGINGTDGTNGTNGTDGVNGTDGTGVNGTDGTNGTTGTSSGSGSGVDWGDYIDDLLGNDSNDSIFNSGGSDWANSNGGSDGYGNLDDYFNGTGYGEDGLPGGLTEDLLGVDDQIGAGEAMMDSLIDSDGDGIPDAYADGTPLYNEDGSFNGSDQAGDTYYYTGGGNGGGYYGDGGIYGDAVGGDGEGEDGLLGAMGKLVDATLPLDDLSNDISNLIGGADDSLIKKMKSLVGDPETVDKTSVSEQDLFDIAKKLLLDNGFTLDDLRRGKNYDAGSAYTEPVHAWDLNRITTLLRGKRIQLASTDKKNVKNAQNGTNNKNSLTSATNTAQSKPQAQNNGQNKQATTQNNQNNKNANQTKPQGQNQNANNNNASNNSNGSDKK